MTQQIITEIKDSNHFTDLLKQNPGLFIIKFGAEWCGPCKTINEGVKWCFERMPDSVHTAIIDIDKCIELYSYLKSKRVINGVPVIICYRKNNLNYIPDDIVIGANKNQINDFFNRCKLYLQ
jgi:thiol-disulfide isomerase/thioredoxin